MTMTKVYLVAVLLAAGGVAGSAQPRTQSPHDFRAPAGKAATAVALAAKPTARFAIRLTQDAAITSASTPAAARLVVQSLVPGTVNFEVALEATGRAVLAQPAGPRFTLTAADPTREIPIEYRVSGAGSGELHARVVARDESGRLIGPLSAVLYLGSNGAEVVHSAADPKAVELLQLARSRAANRMSEAAYRDNRSRVAGGGATSLVGRTPAQAEMRIQGHVRWTDSAGHTHPVAFAPVEIVDGANASSAVLAATTTDQHGAYSTRMPDTLVAAAIQVRVEARGPDFVIRTSAGDVQFIASDVVWCGRGSRVIVDLVANNVDSNNTAFSVHAALSTATAYVVRRVGHRLQPIDVIFPSFGTFYDPRTTPPQIQLLNLDRFDWDVSMHEYSHHVLRSLGLDDSPGGSHVFGDNMSEYLGKHDGISLAFNEGLATYLSITMQIAEGGEALGIPFVGDTFYTDTEDFGLYYDLETDVLGFIGEFEIPFSGVGEDDEISVQRVVWDFYDSDHDAGDFRIGMGEEAVWDTLVRARPVTLSAAVDALFAAVPRPKVALAGCILGEQHVSPTAILPAPAVTARATPPTFEWVPNGGGPSFRNNAFVVQLFADGRPAPLLTSPVLSTPTFTPTAADWAAVLQRAGRSIRWVVTGMQTDAPPTGPYPSCVNTMTVAR